MSSDIHTTATLNYSKSRWC